MAKRMRIRTAPIARNGHVKILIALANHGRAGDLGRLGIDQGNHVLHRPKPIRDPGGHCWRHLQRLVENSARLPLRLRMRFWSLIAICLPLSIWDRSEGRDRRVKPDRGLLH